MFDKYTEFVLPRDRAKLHMESDRAEEMFRKFLSGNFSYNEISNQPDYLGYASVEVLVTILPVMIDEMLKKKDTGNYLVYPMTTAVDPDGNASARLAVRTRELAKLVDKVTVDKICNFLQIMKNDPPDIVDGLDKIIKFWDERCSSHGAITSSRGK